MILNLRGPSGSGKSYVGLQLLVQHQLNPIYDETQIGVLLAGDLVVMGEAGRSTRNLRPYNRIFTAIESMIQQHDFVFVEGLVLSNRVAPWLELSQRLGRGQITFAFLNTPLDLCIERISRRNNGRPFREDRVAYDHGYMQRLATRFHDSGESVMCIDYSRSVEQVTQLLEKAGWCP